MNEIDHGTAAGAQPGILIPGLPVRTAMLRNELIELAVRRHGPLDNAPVLVAARALISAQVEQLENLIAAGEGDGFDLANEAHRRAIAWSFANSMEWLFQGMWDVPSHETLASIALAEMGAS